MDDLTHYKQVLKRNFGDTELMVNSFMQKIDESVCKTTLISGLKHRLVYERASYFEQSCIRQIIERLQE